MTAPVYRPIETRRDTLPAWVLLLAAALLALAAGYLLTNLAPPASTQLGGASPPPGAAAPGGQSPGAPGATDAVVDVAAAEALIEEGGCQACHGPDLGGQASFPSLLQVAEGPVSDNLQDLDDSHPEDWANLWIAGDDPEVADRDRRGMPTFAERFTPEEIELIVEYLQSL